MRVNTNRNKKREENRNERTQQSREDIKNRSEKNNSLLSAIYKMAIGDIKNGGDRK